MKCTCPGPCDIHSNSNVCSQPSHSPPLGQVATAAQSVLIHAPPVPVFKPIHQPSFQPIQPSILSIPQPTTSIIPPDYDHDSSSSSPTVSFYDPSDRPSTPVPVKLWSSIRRLFDALVPPKNLRNPPDYSPYFAEESNIDQLSCTLSSHQSSAEIPGRSISNSFRRLERHYVHPPDDQELQPIGNTQYRHVSLTPPTPASSPRLLHRCPASRSEYYSNPHHPNYFDFEGDPSDYQTPRQNPIPSFHENPALYPPVYNQRSQPTSQDLSTHPEGDFQTITPAGHNPPLPQNYIQISNAPITAKVFSNLPPKQTISGVIKVAPTARKPPSYASSQGDSFQPTPLSVTITRKAASNATNPLHPKTSRGSYNRPPVQLIQKPNPTNRLRKPTSTLYGQPQQPSNTQGGSRSRNSSLVTNNVDNGFRHPVSMPSHHNDASSTLAPPTVGIQLKLGMSKKQSTRSSEKPPHLLRSGLGVKDGKRTVKKGSGPARDLELAFRTNSVTTSNVAPFFQAMHERQEQSLKVMESGVIENFQAPADADSVNERNGNNNEITPVISTNTPRNVRDEVKEEQKAADNLTDDEFTFPATKNNPRKSFLASKKLRSHIRAPSPSLSSQTATNKPEKILRRAKQSTSKQQSEPPSATRPRSLSGAKLPVQASRKTRLPRAPSSSKGIGSTLSKTASQNPERSSSLAQKTTLPSQKPPSVPKRPTEVSQKASSISQKPSSAIRRPTLTTKSVTQKASSTSQRPSSKTPKPPAATQKQSAVTQVSSAGPHRALPPAQKPSSSLQQSTLVAQKTTSSSQRPPLNPHMTRQTSTLHMRAVRTQKAPSTGQRLTSITPKTSTGLRPGGISQKSVNSMKMATETTGTQKVLVEQKSRLITQSDSSQKVQSALPKQPSVTSKKLSSETHNLPSSSQKQASWANKIEHVTQRPSLLSQKTVPSRHPGQASVKKVAQSHSSINAVASKPPLPRARPQSGTTSSSQRGVTSKIGATTPTESTTYDSGHENTVKDKITSYAVKSNSKVGEISPTSKARGKENEVSKIDEDMKGSEKQKESAYQFDGTHIPVASAKQFRLKGSKEVPEVELKEVVKSNRVKELTEKINSRENKQKNLLTPQLGLGLAKSKVQTNVRTAINRHVHSASASPRLENAENQKDVESTTKVRSQDETAMSAMDKNTRESNSVPEREIKQHGENRSVDVKQMEKVGLTNGHSIIDIETSVQMDFRKEKENRDSMISNLKTIQIAGNAEMKETKPAIPNKESTSEKEIHYPREVTTISEEYEKYSAPSTDNENMVVPSEIADALKSQFGLGAVDKNGEMQAEGERVRLQNTGRSEVNKQKRQVFGDEDVTVDVADFEVRRNEDSLTEQDEEVRSNLTRQTRKGLSKDGEKMDSKKSIIERLNKATNEIEKLDTLAYELKSQEKVVNSEEVGNLNVLKIRAEREKRVVSRDENLDMVDKKGSELESSTSNKRRDKKEMTEGKGTARTRRSKEIKIRRLAGPVATPEPLSPARLHPTVKAAFSSIENQRVRSMEVQPIGLMDEELARSTEEQQIISIEEEESIGFIEQQQVSPIEEESVTEHFNIPPLELPHVSEFSLVEPKLSENNTSSLVEHDSPYIHSPHRMDRATMPLETDSIHHHQSAEEDDIEEDDDFMYRRASDSVCSDIRYARACEQYRGLSDLFESDLFESDLSPSILPSTGDLFKLKNIQPVQWTMRRSRYHQKVAGVPTGSPSLSASSISSRHSSSTFVSTGAIPSAKSIYPSPDIASNGANVSSAMCPCSSMVCPNCPCHSHGVALAPVSPMHHHQLSSKSPTSPVTPEAMFSSMVSSDWAVNPFRRMAGNLKLERRIMHLQMLRQQLRERAQTSVGNMGKVNCASLGRLQLFKSRLEKQHPVTVDS